MKAQSLWAGNDYAYIRYRGRGQSYDYKIQRVRIIMVMEEKKDYNKNATTYAEVKFLDWDGNPTETQDARVRARDIVDFWADWWNDISSGEETNGERLIKQKAYVEEQEKVKEQQRLEYIRQREEREAAEAERRAQLQMKRNRIIRKLESVGLDANKAIIAYDGRAVTIHDPELTLWIEEGVKVIDI